MSLHLQGLRRSLGQRLSQPGARLLARAGVSPNLLTGLGFALALGAAWALAQGQFLAGGLLVLLAGAFDLLDGAVARLQGRTSLFGALWDSTLDRLGEAALFGGLLVSYVQEGARLQIYLLFAALVASLTVSYVKARAEGLGLGGEAGLFTRVERVLVLALGLLTGQVTVALGILAVLGFLTAAQRLIFYGRQGRGR